MARDDQSPRWQPPDRLAPPKQRWGWAEEVIQDGEKWLQGQPFWSDLGKAQNLIRGKEQAKADENRSDLTSNRLKTKIRIMVAALSDVRHPDSLSSKNKAYAKECEMLTNVSKGVWYDAKASVNFRRMTQWMMTGGTASIWPVYRRRRLVDPYSNGICFDDYGPCDVVPFMMPPDNNIQGCYATTAIRMVPIPWAHAMFPAFQDRLKAVGKKRMETSAVSARLQLINAARGSGSAGLWCDQLCELRYTQVRDLRFNNTDLPIPMGEPGASWSYVVPALGAEIASMEVKGGQRVMRPATIEDCRLYPNMRLMVTGSGCNEPIYDGPAWAWHGIMPPRFFADDWAWEPMGFSIIRDVLDTERTRQFTERAVDMKIKAQMDPTLIYDTTANIPQGTAEAFDPWGLRGRLGVEGDVDKVLRTAIPVELMKVGAEPFEWLKYLGDSQDENLGTDQMNALAKAKMQVGAEDASDLLKMSGPIVRDISASEESPMSDVLTMSTYLALQHFTTAEVMSYVGPDGITEVTFDFDPNSLVPSHAAGEDTGNPSQFSRMERAKNFARNFKWQVPPGGIHGLPQTQQKLLLLQGQRAGSPIPHRLIFEKVYGLNNYEALRDEWRDDKMWELEMAAKLKMEGASLLPGAPPGTSTESGSQKGTGGRPASGRKPPAAKTKASAQGPRAVVSESG